ncbi:hypothetical protein ACL_0152 [Acholeplasma laidlawii PG-8A]|uniref:Uncharacterized protein n=1 Tax=Acholeplasma laidlawii (strain PG-8A) TaxID=441768 RepID=A9NEJ8_ACHLI|nr:hypothetical protein ACL_0152 [Acholeplasma laidlawii PG-8A]
MRHPFGCLFLVFIDLYLDETNFTNMDNHMIILNLYLVI